LARLIDRDFSLNGDRARECLARLREAFAAEGLYIVRPLPAAELGAASLETGADRSQAGDMILVGDGGPDFFARFQAERTEGESANPLDDFTRARVEQVVGSILGSARISCALFFPFPVAGEPLLPFQRLGRASGLPAPGPLGLQIHPVFGPWWAYRALIATPFAFPVEPPFLSACTTCTRPCVRECAQHGSGSVTTDDADPGYFSGCGDACGARDRCPFGVEYRYPDAQIDFHARAREAMIAAARAG